MKQFIYTLGLFFIGTSLVIGQTQTENYVQSTTYQVPVQTESAANNLAADDKVERISYYDGLGRPIQGITKQAGGQKQDIITATVYDGFGRQSKQYLPYARSTSHLNIATNILPNSNGTIPAIDTFYLNKFPEDLDASAPNPYSETIFENSPLNRVLEQAAPGEDWRNTSVNDHTIKFEYSTNSLNPDDPFANIDSNGNYYDNVRLFSVAHPNNNTEQTQLVFEGYYDASTLYKTVTKDENWQPNQQYSKDHTTEEFKDKQGRVILKRTYNEGIAHDTQYVYDDFGNLTYVLSPKGSDQVLAQHRYRSNTTTFSFSQIGPFLKGLTGSGGGNVNVNSMINKITVNFDFSFNGSYNLRQGPIVMIDSNISNMAIGTISGNGYSYDVSIEEGYLHLTGSGLVTSHTETLIVDIPEYYVDDTVLDDLCYQYHYDYRNRLIEKKIPQKGWEYIIYDKLDRPVGTQDANLRASNHWLFTKYDAFGRVAYTGKLLNLDDNRVAFQERVNNQTVLHETPTTALNTSIAGYEMYYTNAALDFPNAAISYTDLYTINYYDTYNAHLTAVAANPGVVYGINTTTQTKTLATGSRVQVLDGTGSHWVTSVSYYDEKARPIYAASHNSLLGSTDIVKTELDFTGKVIQTENTHIKNTNTIVVHDAFTYDHAARLLTQVQTINGGTPELIVNNHYDELGQLIAKNVGGTVATHPSQSNGLQNIDYTYNIRGWLKSINDHQELGDDLFGFKLNYNTTDLSGSETLYNGNISESLWRTSNDVSASVLEHGYSYKYDALNRITSAEIVNDGASGFDNAFNLQYTSYDKNGNLLSLGRSGWDDSTTSILSTMDALIYKYNGNQLTKVIENGNVNHGFKGALSNYTYDANGNMTKDSGKGINTPILYNHLNLPTQVTVANDNITYIYDATGIKLEKQVIENASITKTQYAGNYIYKDDNLEFFSHSEGYVTPVIASSGAAISSWNYVYQYKDHLGNVRLSYELDEENSVIINENYSGVTADYTWIGGPSVGHDVINGQLHFSAPNKWQNMSKYIDFVPHETVHIEFDFEKGDMELPILFIKEKINGVWESNADRDYFILEDGHFEVDLNLSGDQFRIYFEKGNASDHGTLTTCRIDNLIITQNIIEVVEENNYYPFGLLHKGYNNVVSANGNSTAQKYGYNGKELNDELGLNWNDYGWRNYDASLGRWMNVDNLAEKYMSSSPYHYAGNNPILYLDIDGNEFTESAWAWVNRLISDINSRQERNSERNTQDQQTLDELTADGRGDSRKARRLQRRINRRNSQNTELETVRGEIATLAASDQVYDVVNDSSGTERDAVGNSSTTNSTSFNYSNGNVEITVSSGTSLGLFAHELKHAHQFEVGQISLGERGSTGRVFLMDKHDELAGYQRQGLFGSNQGVTTTSQLPENYNSLPTGPVDVNTFRMQGRSIQQLNEIQRKVLARITNQAYRYNGKTYTK